MLSFVCFLKLFFKFEVIHLSLLIVEILAFSLDSGINFWIDLLFSFLTYGTIALHVDGQTSTTDRTISSPLRGTTLNYLFSGWFPSRPTDPCLLSAAGFRGWPPGTECPMEEHDNMDYFYQQVLQKDVTRRLQVGQDLIDYLNDPQRSYDVEQDKPRLDKTIDELTGWVNSSNFKVINGGGGGSGEMWCRQSSLTFLQHHCSINLSAWSWIIFTSQP